MLAFWAVILWAELKYKNTHRKKQGSCKVIVRIIFGTLIEFLVEILSHTIPTISSKMLGMHSKQTLSLIISSFKSLLSWPSVLFSLTTTPLSEPCFSILDPIPSSYTKMKRVANVHIIPFGRRYFHTFIGTHKVICSEIVSARTSDTTTTTNKIANARVGKVSAQSAPRISPRL